MNGSWKIVVENIENTLKDCLLKIGETEAELDSLEVSEFSTNNHQSFQENLIGDVGKIEIVLNSINSQFNILTLEIESSANEFRDWINKANQFQDKVKLICCSTNDERG
jgi:hypothetical protein